MFMHDNQHIIEGLRSKNLRITKLRRAIIEILTENNIPMAVSELRSLLSKFNLKIHKTSVYRELSVLKEQGFIQEIQFGEDKKRYEILQAKHHHHIICTSCKKIEDVVLEEDSDSQYQKIMVQKNFKVLNHSLEFFGLCGSCNN